MHYCHMCHSTRALVRYSSCGRWYFNQKPIASDRFAKAVNYMPLPGSTCLSLSSNSLPFSFLISIVLQNLRQSRRRFSKEESSNNSKNCIISTLSRIARKVFFQMSFKCIQNLKKSRIFNKSKNLKEFQKFEHFIELSEYYHTFQEFLKIQKYSKVEIM